MSVNNDRYQTLMLDHLYGLLDTAEVAELEAFLNSGPDGEALRRQGEEWKLQIARASKSAFPAVQFAAPARGASKPAPAKAQPLVKKRGSLAADSTKRAGRAWLPWVVAASVAAVVAGFGVPVARQAAVEMEEARDVRARLFAYEDADRRYNEVASAYNAREGQAAREARDATEQHATLEKEFAKAVAEARKQVEDKQFIVRLSGPGRAQPGAPNHWRVDMFKRNGVRATSGKIEWQVKDADGQVVWSEVKQAPTRQGFLEPPTVSLPIAFWEKVKPQSDLTLEVVAYEDNLRSKVNAKVPLAQPVFVTHLATDKPLYKPGETVFFRSLTLDRATFTPPEKDMTLEFRITRPGGQPETILRGSARGFTDPAHPLRELIGPDKKPLRGVGCGQFELEPASPGGEYVLSVVDVTPSFDEVARQVRGREVVLETRKFNVIEYKPENILKTLEFDGKSYGAGDTVFIKATAEPVQGGKRKLGVKASARVDGKNVPVQVPSQTEPDGTVRLKIVLPSTITRGEGSVDVTFSDGAESDVISRPIPLIGRIINVEFFPEGGDLVEGVPNRVYFQATLPNGKPADLKGYITDGSKTVAEVATLTDADLPGVNRGQGSFTFVPEAGKHYFLKVRKPTGIAEPLLKGGLSAAEVAKNLGLSHNALGAGSLALSLPTGFELPKAKPDGVVLTALAPVSEPDQPVRVALSTAKGKKSVHVGAYTRGNLLDHQVVEVAAGKPVEVALKPAGGIGGVTRVTVFEERDTPQGPKTVPVAERLVYHKPAEKLALNVIPDRSRYNPGSKVMLDLQAADEDDRPVPAVVMVAVVNQNVLTMADEKTGRLMPTHFLLASEVKKPEDLEHADFLLGDTPKAGEALDLLLGTQGWRRFAEQNVTSPKAQPDVDRLLVSNGQRAQAPVETLRQELEKVHSQFRPKVESSLVRLSAALDAHAAVEADFGRVRPEVERLYRERAEADREYHKALAQLQDLHQERDDHGGTSLLKLCAGLLLIAVVCVGVAVARRAGGLGYVAAAAGCFALCAVALLGTSLARRDGDVQQVALAAVKLQAPPEVAEALQMEFDALDRPADMAGLGANAGKAERAAMGGFGGGGGMAKKEAENLREAKGEAMRMEMRALPVPPMMPPAGAARPNAVPARDGNFMMDRVAEPQKAFKAVEKAKGLALNGHMKQAAGDELADAKDRGRIAAARRQLDAADKFKRGLLAGTGEFNRLQNVRQEQLRKMIKEQAPGMPLQAGMMAAEPAMGYVPAMENRAADGYEQLLMQASQEPGFYVREYRHQKATAANRPDVRDDFTETVCWHPVLVIPESGRADVQFQLSDSIARYQVLVAGHTLDGRIGASVTHVEARKPFTVDPKVPIEITAGDRIDVPVRVVNDSDVRRTVTFRTTPDGLVSAADGKADPSRDSLDLGADGRGRKVLSYRAAKKEGTASLTVVGSSDPVETPDHIVRAFRVVPDGFPAAGSVSDLLEKRANATITLPEVVKGTLKVQVQVYPTSLADLQGGLEGLLQEPGGCFEQTSTSNYPNIMILDYLKASDQVKPELAQRAKGLLDRGYAKLIAFECPDSADKAKQGFEWFGQMDQQHQALTAYGLLQFKDLDRAYPGKVDPELIRRTQQYLLSQQTPNKDGFKRNARALDSFGRAPEAVTNAYIVWALTESDPDDKEGMVDLAKQLDALKTQAKTNNDPYFLALVANALLNRPTGGNREEAIAILDRIVEKNLKNGSVEGAATSITCSGGRDQQIETTALAVLGWLRSGEPTKFVKAVKDATKWIGQQRGGHGAFGSTQSTILALRALVEYTKASRKPAEAGEVVLTVNGKTFKKAFTEKDQEVITLDVENPEEVFKLGVNEAVVELNTKQAYPFALTWSANTQTPLSAEKCQVEVATKLDRENVLEGETVRVDVSLTNKVDKAHGMAVAVVGLPGGCRLPADLKELTKLREDNKIAFFEVRGRELVIYWRALKPSEKIDVSFNAICEVPGQYTGPASRGYLYYNADHKHWVKPLAVTITAANQPGDESVASK